MNVNLSTMYDTMAKMPFGKQLCTAGLKVQSKSPEILLATGIVTVIGGTVLACKETLKATGVMDEYKKMRNDVEGALKLAEENPDEVVYTEETHRQDLVRIYAKTGVGLAKVYFPSVAVIGLGVAAILASHGILRTRNVAMVAAYDTVKKGFDAYRDRVVQKFGDDVDKQLRFGLTEKNVTEKSVDDDGVEHKAKVVRKSFDPTAVSEYARWYSKETSREFYSKSPELNFTRLKSTESYCNNRLHARGFLFLNEVYNELGLNYTQAGQVVGWLDNGDGDGFVDFGILDVRNREAVNGNDPDGVNAYLLDFNVDGPIMDKI